MQVHCIKFEQAKLPSFNQQRKVVYLSVGEVASDSCLHLIIIKLTIRNKAQFESVS